YGLRPCQRADLLRGADRHDLVARDGERLGGWTRIVGGPDLAIHEDAIGARRRSLRARRQGKADQRPQQLALPERARAARIFAFAHVTFSPDYIFQSILWLSRTRSSAAARMPAAKPA